MDICAVLEERSEVVFEQLNTNILNFGSSEQASHDRQYLESIYRKPEDIPLIIAPTEDGWKEAYLNRKITDGEATILITSKNAKATLKKDIKILTNKSPKI